MARHPPVIEDLHPHHPSVEGALRVGHVHPVRAAWAAADGYARSTCRVDLVRLVTPPGLPDLGPRASAPYVRLTLTHEAAFLLTAAEARQAADAIEAECLTSRAHTEVVVALLRDAAGMLEEAAQPQAEAAI